MTPIAYDEGQGGWYFPNSGVYYPTRAEAEAAYARPERGAAAGQAYARAQNPTQLFDWSQTQNPTITDKATGATVQQGTNPSGGFGFEQYVLPALMAATGFGAAGMGPLAGAGATGTASAGGFGSALGTQGMGVGSGAVGADVLGTPAWALPTAGGVADTGFGAGIVPPTGAPMGEFDFLDNVDFSGLGDVAGGMASPEAIAAGAAPATATGGLFNGYGLGEAFGGMASPEAVAGGAAPASAASGAFNLPDWLKNPSNINTVLKALGISVPGLAPTGGATGGPQTPGSYQFPYADILGAGLGYLSSQSAQKTQQELMDKAINSDLFRQSQPSYFQPALDAATKGIGNTPYGQSIMDTSARKMASMGYNMSGNQMSQLGQDLNRGTVDYMNAIGPYARGNGGVGSTIASMTPGIVGSQNAGFTSLGAGIGSILSGQQPTSNQQRTGTPANQTLPEWLKGL